VGGGAGECGDSGMMIVRMVVGGRHKGSHVRHDPLILINYKGGVTDVWTFVSAGDSGDDALLRDFLPDALLLQGPRPRTGPSAAERIWHI